MNRWRLGSFLLLASLPTAGWAVQVDPPVREGPDGRLLYATEADGDRLPDFSAAGYRGGGVSLPRVPTVFFVEPGEGDDGARIQAALDAVAARELSAAGWRGAVQLAPGRFEVGGSLRLAASGVVLRGSGDTTVVATGTGRRTLIEVRGVDDLAFPDDAVPISDERVPVGATTLTVTAPEAFSIGDRVEIRRPGTAEWIAAVGMDKPPARTPYRWRPGQWDMTWERTIVQIDGSRLVLDAPLTTALEQRFGGATVRPMVWPGRLREVGLEHLQLESAFDAAHPHDEEHAWIAIQLDAVEDAWVADVSGRHFVSSLVDLGRGSRAVTVQDCVSLEPVSELAGYRRHSFHTAGQQTLFLRCRAEAGRHDFTAGYLTTGPNVFLECRAEDPHGFSGSIGSWASGLLFDNVDLVGGALRFDNLEIWNQGVGWAVANSMIWQSTAAVIVCRQPPTATNWTNGVWAQFIGDGQWSQTSEFARPESLYRAQLAERRGARALEALAPLAGPAGGDNASPAPAPEPAPTPAETPPLTLANGWLTVAGEILIGREQPIQWWRGSLVPDRASTAAPSLTRFVPGRSGPGLTDDLTALAASMAATGRVSLRHHYGLWYDRRRDDHEMTKRSDADVWPPFYELPWARSGEGEAWNRLSRYDLTRFNPWYFGRIDAFAALARTHRLVLVNEMYFQHNIIESGAHWVDFPWRPANAVQATGFVEPPPFTGDTIRMADAFYDVSQPDRRAWHQLYIRQCLENLANRPNVIHTLTAENSGPLHFMEFWLDVVAAWQAETGHDPLIALSAPKDVQDAILADPVRRAVVDLIDFTYWYRDREGALYAPAGGQSLAPRQHARLWDGSRASGPSIAGMVADYKARFPDLAIITGLGEVEGWSFVAAGGSLAPLPPTTDPRLLASLATMRPVAASADQWTLAHRTDAFFHFTTGDARPVIDLREASGRFRVYVVDRATGQLAPLRSFPSGGSRYHPPVNGPAALWLTSE